MSLGWLACDACTLTTVAGYVAFDVGKGAQNTFGLDGCIEEIIVACCVGCPVVYENDELWTLR